jgi:hypothetical protein
VTVRFSGTGFPAGLVNAKVYLGSSGTALKFSHPTVPAGGKLDVTFSTFKHTAGVNSGTVRITGGATAFSTVSAPFTITCAATAPSSSAASTGPAFPVQATTGGTGTPWFEQPNLLVILGAALAVAAGLLGRGKIRVALRRNH